MNYYCLIIIINNNMIIGILHVQLHNIMSIIAIIEVQYMVI